VGWNLRHTVLFDNARLHPNKRSYFDRFLEYEERPPLELMKPIWRLNPDGEDEEQRLALKELAKSQGANARPVLSSTGPPNMLELELSAEQSQLKLKGKQVDSLLEREQLSIGTIERSVSELVGPKTQWNDRHHVTWCNERQTTGGSALALGKDTEKALNPKNMRSYFDRVRTPHNCRAEVSWKAQKAEGTAALENFEHVRPHWTLDVDPHETLSVSRSSGEVTPGGGGTAFRITQNESSVTSDRNAYWTLEGHARRRKWNDRHQLMFQNDEVSRLDRSYFDRWREPLAVTSMQAEPKGEESNRRADVKPLKPTWALDKDGSPDRTAAELIKQSAERHANGVGRHAVKWNHRHQRIFVNEIHTNLKNYFDRHRAPEEFSGSRRRQKVQDHQKLKVANWSLQNYGAALELGSTLRESESAPALLDSRKSPQRSSGESSKTAGSPGKSSSTTIKRREGAESSKTAATSRKKKERPAWFSSHGIHF